MDPTPLSLVPKRNHPAIGYQRRPLQSLTIDLIATYKACSNRFSYELTRNPRRVLTKPSIPHLNDGNDNEKMDYILYVNDILGNESGHKYLVLDLLGSGTFGQVVQCKNLKTSDIVAVKVVKNTPEFFNQSMMEVTILELLNEKYDPEDKHHIVRLHETFIHKKHLCLVFELLGMNLYELIKQNQFRGLSLNLVRVFLAQILDCMVVLKEGQLIHCDLKPENILLKRFDTTEIKVVDFGSACHEQQTVYTYIQSRFYRSPEVLLNLPYTASIDMWSLGCIAVELFIGLPLFPGSSEYNQISRIVEMLGSPPTYMLEMGKNCKLFFDKVINPNTNISVHILKSLEQYSKEQNTEEKPSKRYFTATTIADLIKSYPITSRKALNNKDLLEKEMQNRLCFIDFVCGLLKINPLERWTPKQARSHPFISGEKWNGPFIPPMTMGINDSFEKKIPMPTLNVTNSESIPISTKTKKGQLVEPRYTRPRAYTISSLGPQNVPHQLQELNAASTMQKHQNQPPPILTSFSAQPQLFQSSQQQRYVYDPVHQYQVREMQQHLQQANMAALLSPLTGGPNFIPANDYPGSSESAREELNTEDVNRKRVQGQTSQKGRQFKGMYSKVPPSPLSKDARTEGANYSNTGGYGRRFSYDSNALGQREAGRGQQRRSSLLTSSLSQMQKQYGSDSSILSSLRFGQNTQLSQAQPMYYNQGEESDSAPGNRFERLEINDHQTESTQMSVSPTSSFSHPQHKADTKMEHLEIVVSKGSFTKGAEGFHSPGSHVAYNNSPNTGHYGLPESFTQASPYYRTEMNFPTYHLPHQPNPKNPSSQISNTQRSAVRVPPISIPNSESVLMNGPVSARVPGASVWTPTEAKAVVTPQEIPESYYNSRRNSLQYNYASPSSQGIVIPGQENIHGIAGNQHTFLAPPIPPRIYQALHSQTQFSPNSAPNQINIPNQHEGALLYHSYMPQENSIDSNTPNQHHMITPQSPLYFPGPSSPYYPQGNGIPFYPRSYENEASHAPAQKMASIRSEADISQYAGWKNSPISQSSNQHGKQKHWGSDGSLEEKSKERRPRLGSRTNSGRQYTRNRPINYQGSSNEQNNRNLGQSSLSQQLQSSPIPCDNSNHNYNPAKSSQQMATSSSYNSYPSTSSNPNSPHIP